MVTVLPINPVFGEKELITGTLLHCACSSRVDEDTKINSYTRMDVFFII